MKAWDAAASSRLLPAVIRQIVLVHNPRGAACRDSRTGVIAHDIVPDFKVPAAFHQRIECDASCVVALRQGVQNAHATAFGRIDAPAGVTGEFTPGDGYV